MVIQHFWAGKKNIDPNKNEVNSFYEKIINFDRCVAAQWLERSVASSRFGLESENNKHGHFFFHKN